MIMIDTRKIETTGEMIGCEASISAAASVKSALP